MTDGRRVDSVAPMATADGTVQADAAALEELARGLSRCGRELADLAGGVPHAIPAVPEDEHGIGPRIVALDDLRAQLDRRTADAFEAVGRRLGNVAARATEADRTPVLGPPR
jgi:hypothetical protein